MDASENVYVSRTDYSDETLSDFVTLKYDAAGAEQWVKRYNGPGNSHDQVYCLAVDAAGNVYVAGYTDRGDDNFDYATIKYSQTQTVWAVSTFTLIDADTDQAIRELKDGETINLADLGTLNLNIRANTNPDAVGSVVFSLSGAATRKYTENIHPYALFADNQAGDYYAWTPKNGNYKLTATPYSAAKGKGKKGTPLTIHFTVTGQVVSSLVLVNAKTDQDIKTLMNGDVIDLSTLPTEKLNIRAIVHPGKVGSVVFNLDNRYVVQENLAPYAIGGDNKGDYRAWVLPEGQHTLTATPYDKAGGKGKKGKAHSVSFTVVDMSATIHAAKGQQNLSTDAVHTTVQSIVATPNPFSSQTTISFMVPKSGYSTVQVYDMKGRLVARLFEAQANAGNRYTVSFRSKELPAGLYMVKVVTGKYVQFHKLVLTK